MMSNCSYRHKIDRRGQLRKLVLARLLRRNRFNFDNYPKIMTILGDHIGDEIRAHGRYEERVLNFLGHTLFATGGRGTAVDVGANIGNHSLFLARVFANVIAFEPNPAARTLLEMNLAINDVDNVAIEPVGLSDRASTETMMVDRANLGASHVEGARDDGSATTGGYPVSIDLEVGDRRIDALLDIGFIKIDIEGKEEDALIGLEQTIRRSHPIIMIEQLSGAIDTSSGTSPSHAFLLALDYTAHEVRSKPHFGSPWLQHGYELIMGRVRQELVRIDRLEKRNYPALIYIPS